MAPFHEKGIVFGPISSPQLGRSLGVNPLPSPYRVCSYDCWYCPFRHLPPGLRETRWPTPGEVGSALANVLPEAGRLDSITLSGHGEPTLHPRFGSLVAEVLSAARHVRPGVPVRIVTNGSTLPHEDIRRALDLLDERIVKLDAAAERVCRPDCSHPLGAVIAALPRLRDMSIQSCFVEGRAQNTDPDSVREWVELVSELRPQTVQIYTPSWLGGEEGVAPVPGWCLEEIAEQLAEHSGIRASVYKPEEQGGTHPSVYK
jgi:wyosine [tRNA(Phe)-imidazoG37] synthetase (radical SAM superfamily)